MDVFHLTCRAWWLRVLVWCLGAAVVVACCQTAGCCFWGEEVDNFNETVRWCDLRGPGLGLPEVHTLPETCGPVPSLLQHKLILLTLPTLTKCLGNFNFYHLPSLMNQTSYKDSTCCWTTVRHPQCWMYVELFLFCSQNYIYWGQGSDVVIYILEK